MVLIGWGYWTIGGRGFAGIASGGLGFLGNAISKLPNVASTVSGMQQKSQAAFNNPTGIPGGVTPQEKLMQLM